MMWFINARFRVRKIGRFLTGQNLANKVAGRIDDGFMISDS
jgi:hypothetical protein